MSGAAGSPELELQSSEAEQIRLAQLEIKLQSKSVIVFKLP